VAVLGQHGQSVTVAFHVSDRQGASRSDATEVELKLVLAELDGTHDPEHPDVALSHESGWTLSAFESGLLVWENLEEDDEPRHMTEVSRSEVLRLWLALARRLRRPARWRPTHL
jgi:hypothetical protein